jgi:predicted DCC family thiol-disulfide oxidoreductase YuxK
MDSDVRPVVLYDGVCALCNRLVRFVIRRDRRDYFRFSAIQSDFSQSLLRRRGVDPHLLDTVYLVTGRFPHEHLLSRSEAVAEILKELGGIWKISGVLFSYLPKMLRDRIYRMVASSRYRVFGKFQACPVPDATHRHKFLDLHSAQDAPRK